MTDCDCCGLGVEKPFYWRDYPLCDGCYVYMKQSDTESNKTPEDFFYQRIHDILARSMRFRERKIKKEKEKT